MNSPCLLGQLDPAQLCRARLRIAWEMLAQAAEHLDLVPQGGPAARGLRAYRGSSSSSPGGAGSGGRVP